MLHHERELRCQAYDDDDCFARSATSQEATTRPDVPYECAMKCSHLFNLLDARGVIAVNERTLYISRVRNLAVRVAKQYVRKYNEPVEKPE